MKAFARAVSLFLLFIIALQSAAYTQTNYEKRLEFRRKKITIVERTAFVKETTGYVFSNTSSLVNSERPRGRSFGSSATFGTTDRQTSMRQVFDWVIVRGGIAELSDIEFLDIIGDTNKADRVQSTIDDKNRMMFWALGCEVVGIAAIIGAASVTPVNSTQTAVGSALMLGGMLMGYFYGPERHYISPDQAQEGADNYNIKLKRSLGLPIETE